MKKIALVFFLVIVFSGFLYTPVNAQTSEEKKAQLEAELRQLETEIAQKEAELAEQKKKSGTLKGDVTILTTQIKQLKLDIKKKNLTIEKLRKEISEKSQTITTLSEKIDDHKSSLAQLLRKTREIDSLSFVHFALASEDLSDFYADVESFSTLQEAIKQSVDEIKGIKTQTEQEKKSLEQKQNEETDTKVALEGSKRLTETKEKEKKTLLSVSQKKESEYQKILAEKAKRASEIRATLFNLRDTVAIPFSQALEYAQIAQQKTGVRPAFLLAIIQQESSMGANVGSCYLTNQATGEGVSVKTKASIARVMKPARDISIFINLLDNLGLKMHETRVSCPQSFGWGGAMGPAQFIPSTWNIINSRLSTLIDKNIPDPWNPYDAFIASALYLSDLGADNGGYTAERNAACRYYSGSSCSNSRNATSYGNQVMSKARNIQENMIDPLQGF
ncbi:hypothetical protein A3I25_00185 [Candidatus Nomurabacteria bacterium RIFCSPLOWO2_02_FULL_42_17]|uniref:Transglycosylase SLT domain-containing protein n=2 Tax=Candidatus Nomuraibacteriota TaxID=1752729 RepID=A0A1F6WHG5_9BACT|nr:MAG: hypothetical protein UV08_C0007G0011 [Parcubacteria group bacterium GW2011_GWA2_42_18]OGI81343.1 MAG: hypothetical protein A3B93_01150 [Candidatus Nomurabacteria bacterium RIFCSPHIGHO2_02_FULL_42_24]OGI97669.1 MAG: hypothetical protein A3I25_00185 [Candidatus Nomurabacteria bacterium RIFCSPLOWO2_02_FULL_42_17]